MFPINMIPVLDQFLRKIWAYDETGSVVDHIYQKTKGSAYWFVGVILPTSTDDLQLLDEGLIKKKSITVYTRNKKLYFIDSAAEDATQVQTFFKYDDDVYRVYIEANRSADGMYRKYLAVKYLDRDNEETA